MNQDLAVGKALESIKSQLGVLSMKQIEVIGSHLYCVYAAGTEWANKEKKTCKPVKILNYKGGIRTFPSLSEAARSIGADKGSVWRALNGRRRQKMVRGYQFEYE